MVVDVTVSRRTDTASYAGWQPCLTAPVHNLSDVLIGRFEHSTSMRLTHARARRTCCTHLLDDAERAAAGLRLHHAANRASWAEQKLHQTATHTNTGTCHQGRWTGGGANRASWAEQQLHQTANIQTQGRVTRGGGGGPIVRRGLSSSSTRLQTHKHRGVSSCNCESPRGRGAV